MADLFILIIKVIIYIFVFHKFEKFCFFQFQLFDSSKIDLYCVFKKKVFF